MKQTSPWCQNTEVKKANRKSEKEKRKQKKEKKQVCNVIEAERRGF